MEFRFHENDTCLLVTRTHHNLYASAAIPCSFCGTARRGIGNYIVDCQPEKEINER